jgi:hypothetical protein
MDAVDPKVGDRCLIIHSVSLEMMMHRTQHHTTVLAQDLYEHLDL